MNILILYCYGRDRVLNIYTLSTFKFQMLFSKNTYSPSKKSTHFRIYQTVQLSYCLTTGNPVFVFVCICRNVMPDTMMTVFVTLLHSYFVFLLITSYLENNILYTKQHRLLTEVKISTADCFTFILAYELCSLLKMLL